MKIIGVPRVNALGLSGPENMPKRILSKICGNFEMIDVDNSNIESSESAIFSRAKEVFNSRDRAVFVGGDHSISYPIFRAFSEINKNAFLIVFDAHADCDYPTTNPTHEEWLRAIIERGFDASNVILIGVRKMWKVEREFLEDNGVKFFERTNNVEKILNHILEITKGFDVYVSIDIDVVDPEFAPSVNYPEEDGLLLKELFCLLEGIFGVCNVGAIDVVEAILDEDTRKELSTINMMVDIINKFINSEKI